MLAIGCHVRQTSELSKAPCFAITIFPSMISSAGHPKYCTVPGKRYRSSNPLTAAALPAIPLPNKLWPHAWPGAPALTGACSGRAFWLKPGSASYSPRNEITGFPLPHFAQNAVGSPQTPSSTANPFSFRYAANRRLERCSSSESSAYSQISRLKSASSCWRLSSV